MLPESVKKLIGILSELPSLGPRQATRLVFHLINSDIGAVNELSRSLNDLKTLKICERCFFIAENEKKLCVFCLDQNRRKDLIAIIEKPTDLISLEKSGSFNGQYFILGELSKNGVFGPTQRLRIQNLAERLRNESGVEVLIAVNHTTFGDFTAGLITEELKPFAKKISRLGRGIPTGGEIEFADGETLRNAIERRN